MFEYHSLVYYVSQMSGSKWGDHELLRSVQIPVEHGADDEFSGFDSKEEMVVAAMWIGWLAGLERLKTHWLLRPTSSEKLRMWRKTLKTWLMRRACLQREHVGTQTGIMRATYAESFIRRPHPPTSTGELRCQCWCAA